MFVCFLLIYNFGKKCDAAGVHKIFCLTSYLCVKLFHGVIVVFVDYIEAYNVT